jgi:hypothetical protein
MVLRFINNKKKMSGGQIPGYLDKLRKLFVVILKDINPSSDANKLANLLYKQINNANTKQIFKYK